MRSKQKKRAAVRTFEREARVQRLLDAGIIKNSDEIPADAIPARVEFIEQCRSSLSLHSRPPYFADQRYCCTDCRQWFVWTAEEQRYWFEQLEGSPYSTAARCQRCRRRRRGIPRKTAKKEKR